MLLRTELGSMKIVKKYLCQYLISDKISKQRQLIMNRKETLNFLLTVVFVFCLFVDQFAFSIAKSVVEGNCVRQVTVSSQRRAFLSCLLLFSQSGFYPMSLLIKARNTIQITVRSIHSTENHWTFGRHLVSLIQ